MYCLSASNIAWDERDEKNVLSLLMELGFSGVEIAPTKLYPSFPYSHVEDAKKWSIGIKEKYGMSIPSIQSIWYGKKENIFNSENDRNILFEYTKKAIIFAEAISCGNLVFGCPSNRRIPQGGDPEIAVRFLKELGDYANDHHTTISIEANPPIYNTNFITSTAEAFALAERVDSKGVRVNLDTGTMIENGEGIESIKGKEHLINHIHISEPGLRPISKRKFFAELREQLSSHYSGYISLEMSNTGGYDRLIESLKYVRDVFL